MEDFSSLTAADDLKYVRHNPTNFSAFQKFQEELDERYSKAEEEKAVAERKAHLRKWESSLSGRWKGAKLSAITNPAAQVAIELVSARKTNFFITGEAGVGKTYLAYAIVRRLIGHGLLTPSQVKTISQETMRGLAASGFEGRARFEELFRPQCLMYIFDGVSVGEGNNSKENQLWEQLIDHIYTKSLFVIFTSNDAPDLFSTRLSDSGRSKLEHLIDGTIITMNRSGSPSQDAPPTTLEGTLLDAFKD